MDRFFFFFLPVTLCRITKCIHIYILRTYKITKDTRSLITKYSLKIPKDFTLTNRGIFSSLKYTRVSTHKQLKGGRIRLLIRYDFRGNPIMAGTYA